MISALLFLLSFSLSTYSSADSWSATCGATYCLDTSHGFTLDNYNCVINWSQELLATGNNTMPLGIIQYPDHIFFLNAQLGNNINLGQTFGLGCKTGGSLTMTAIGQSKSTMNGVCTQTTCYLYYYYTGGSTPIEIDLISGSNTYSMPSGQWTTNFAAFNSSGIFPLVYQNTTGGYVEMKHQSPTFQANILFVQGTTTQGGGGGGGGGGGSTSFSTTTMGLSTTTIIHVTTKGTIQGINSPNANVLLAGIIISILIGGAAFIATKRRPKKKQSVRLLPA